MKYKTLIYSILTGISLGLLGLTWQHGWSFVPLFLMASVVVFGFYKSLRYMRFRNFMNDHWRNYLGTVVAVGIACLMVALIISPLFANPFVTISRFTSLKAAERIVGVGVPNTLLTVQEMRPITVRAMIYNLGIAPFLLALAFIPIAFYWLRDRIMRELNFTILMIIMLAVLFYSATVARRFVFFLAIPICVFAGISLAEIVKRAIELWRKDEQ